MRTVYQILENLVTGDETVESAFVLLEEFVKDETSAAYEDGRDEMEYELEKQEHEEMIHQALITGKPDWFGPEMRWFWDNGRLGNV